MSYLRKYRDRFPLLYRIRRNRLLFAPFKNNILNVKRQGALGDVLLCTPALREAKKRNPKITINFYTDSPKIIDGLPYIDNVLPYSDAPPNTITFTYEECIPPRRHIAKLFGDRIGLNIRDTKPDCVAAPTVCDEWQKRLNLNPKPKVVVNRRASQWTPNKDWPTENWNETIEKLCEFCSVFEIGQPSSSDIAIDHASYTDLRGKTNLNDLIAVIKCSDLHVGPISGPVHIAAAFDVPSVVIYGGYESPVCSMYSKNINLTDNPSCSPCWLREPCPYDKKCLNNIPPRLVIESVRKFLKI